MRKTTLYTIKAQEIMAGQFVEIAETKLPPLWHCGDEFMAPLDVASQKLPVYHIAKIKHGEKTEKFIALDPELQEIIESPFKYRAEMAERVLRDFRDEVYEFNDWPWFRRLWYMLTHWFKIPV